MTCNLLVCVCIMMSFTIPSSLRGAAVVLLALAVASVSGECSPSASSFDFVRLSGRRGPSLLILLVLTFTRSSLVAALLAWH